MIVLLLIVVVILYLLVRQWKMRNILKLSRLIRSKYTAWPIVGHGYMFMVSAEDRMTIIQKFARETIKGKYGLTSAWAGSNLCFVTCDAEICEEVTKTCLGKSDMLFNIAKNIVGNSHIFAPVNLWRPRRKLIAPAFSAKNLRYYVEIFAEHSLILTQSLSSVAGRGTFPIGTYFSAYTMDTLCGTTLGIKMNAQLQPLHPFITAMHRYLSLVPARVVLPNRHLEWLLNFLPVYKEMETTIKLMHDFVDDIIRKKHIELGHEYTNKNHNVTVEKGPEPSNYPPNILNENIMTKAEMYQGKSILEDLMTTPVGNIMMSDVDLREEALTLLIAGIDTISVATSFAAVVLSRHMKVQEKAFQEIHNIFGDSKRPVTFEDLPQLKYMEAFIKETLRLYSPVPVILRENDVNVPLASGLVLPAGTSTIINIWGLHRNPKYWGADAEQFNPERFLNGSPKGPRRHSAYMPFSYGARSCLGYKYAMISMKIVMTTLLREYKVLPPSELSPEDLKKPLRVEYKVMIKDADNYRVRLEPRT